MKQFNQRELLKAIWNYQLKSPLYFRSNFSPADLKEPSKSEHGLNNSQKGLYWIWTDYSDKQLEELKESDADNPSEVPIDKLTQQRKCLENICNIIHLKNKKFRVVYNGRGRLRKRILQEFRANSPGTGTLNLLNKKWTNNSGNDESHLKHWAVTFFNFDGVDEQKLIQKVLGEGNYDADKFYNNYASSLEINWRVNYGVPILSRL